MLTREEFNATWATLFASTAWAGATAGQRLTHVEDTFNNLPYVWDIIKDKAYGILTTLFENVRRFGEPDPPSQELDDWFDIWWFANVGAPLQWGASGGGEA